MPIPDAIGAYINQTAARETMPPDPFAMDLSVHRVPGQSVYSVLPFSMAGYAFVVEHEDAGSAHGDCLLVPASNHSFLNDLLDEILDEGLRVV